MFPVDSISVRQVHRAKLTEAAQRRDVHPVVRPRRTRRHPELKALTAGIVAALRPRRKIVTGPLSSDHELFRGLTDEQLARLGRLLTVIDVPAGRSLGRQGAIVRDFVTVIEGRVGVTIDGIPNAVFDDGAHFGALPLLDDGSNPVHRASFSTMAPSRIAVAGPGEFRAIMRDFPLVAERVSAMTMVRRAYLNGLAEAQSDSRPILETIEYPVHMFA